MDLCCAELFLRMETNGVICPKDCSSRDMTFLARDPGQGAWMYSCVLWQLRISMQDEAEVAVPINDVVPT